jgi:hypothetical protein
LGALRAACLAAISISRHDRRLAQTDPLSAIVADGRLPLGGGHAYAMFGASACVDYTSFWQSNEQTRTIRQL